MSIITSPDVIESITEYCEIDRIQAWELYEEWVDDEYAIDESELAYAA